MEIKVQCDCGQKYKFDVEPANGRMPFMVNCPVCGKDGTSHANVILQQLLPPAPIAATVAPPPVPMRPAGLSISRPPTPPPAVAEPQETMDEPEADDKSSNEEGVRIVKLGWKGWGVIVLLVGLAIFGSYLKSAQRSLVRDTLDWVVEKITGKSDSKDGEVGSASGKSPANENVLPDDDGTMLLVKHADQVAVAQACVDFYAEQNKQKLFSLATTKDDAEGLFMVHTMGGVYVQIDGSIFWKEKDVANFTALAEWLSKKFGTISVCALMGDDAETGVVAFYENGERRFRCDRNVYIRNGDLVEDVKLEGQAWATNLGFKPDEEAGWKGFTMQDAENLAQHLGFKSVAEEPKEWIVLSSHSIKP